MSWFSGTKREVFSPGRYMDQAIEDVGEIILYVAKDNRFPCTKCATTIAPICQFCGGLKTKLDLYYVKTKFDYPSTTGTFGAGGPVETAPFACYFKQSFRPKVGDLISQINPLVYGTSITGVQSVLRTFLITSIESRGVDPGWYKASLSPNTIENINIQILSKNVLITKING